MTNSVLKHKFQILLFTILILAASVRFYDIANVPVSLYWDEASSTYNAYSIAKTGNDEFGNKLPLLFRAFEDYKTPANIYLTSIAVTLFGLNEFSARFSSAFLGTLTILVIFFLIKELVPKKLLNIESEYLALLTAFLVAVSPWHIHFSRTGFEANSGLFFIILGVFLFLRSINLKNFKYYYLSMATFAVSFYFYRSIWIFMPLFLVSLFFIYRRELINKENIKKVLLGIILFMVLLLPFAPVMLSSQGMVRANQVAVYKNSSEEVYDSALKQQKENNIIGRIIYNRRIVYISKTINGYIAHYSPKFLFFEGDGNVRHGVPKTGLLYMWGIFFVVPGLIMLFKLPKKSRNLVIAWLIIAPIAAAISVPAPHNLRSLNMIPIPQFILALGIVWVYIKLGKKYQRYFTIFIIALIVFFLINYLSVYFNDYSKKSSSEWADGYKQLVEYMDKSENKYEKVIVSGHYWQPYVYFLFYNKIDPKFYQESGQKNGFGKYVFGGTSWDNGKELGDQDLEKLSGTENYIVALSPIEYDLQKNNINKIDEIKNHNNEVVFIIGTKK